MSCLGDIVPPRRPRSVVICPIRGTNSVSFSSVLVADSENKRTSAKWNSFASEKTSPGVFRKGNPQAFQTPHWLQLRQRNTPENCRALYFEIVKKKKHLHNYCFTHQFPLIDVLPILLLNLWYFLTQILCNSTQHSNHLLTSCSFGSLPRSHFVQVTLDKTHNLLHGFLSIRFSVFINYFLHELHKPQIPTTLSVSLVIKFCTSMSKPNGVASNAPTQFSLSDIRSPQRVLYIFNYFWTAPELHSESFLLLSSGLGIFPVCVSWPSLLHSPSLRFTTKLISFLYSSQHFLQTLYIWWNFQAFQSIQKFIVPHPINFFFHHCFLCDENNTSDFSCNTEQVQNSRSCTPANSSCVTRGIVFSVTFSFMAYDITDQEGQV